MQRELHRGPPLAGVAQPVLPDGRYWLMWRASQIPDRGPNRVPPGMEDYKCRRNGEDIRLSSNLRRPDW